MLEGVLNILLFLLIITQGIVMFIFCIASLKLWKSSNKLWVEMKKQLDKNIKLLQSDRDGDYLFGYFNKYLFDNGMLSQLSEPGIPQQNSVAERRNWIFLGMMRSMMSYSDRPKFLCGCALEMAAYILNSFPTKSAPNTLVEL